jgi:hypothetical protein
LLQGNSRQGFDFDEIEHLLTDDLNDNESASPFIVVYTDADTDEYDKLMQSLSELRAIGQQIDFGGPDFYELIKAYRNLKKDIFRHIAPYSLRRTDVQRDFEKHFKERQLYMELDFYLVLNPSCYDAETIGWRIDAETLKESEGLFDF